MDSNTFPALDASADAPPHDEWCTKLLSGLPVEERAEDKACLCKFVMTIRADEDMKILKSIKDAPDLSAARKTLDVRVVQNLLVALMPSGR